jgi:hypothetical protein
MVLPAFITVFSSSSKPLKIISLLSHTVMRIRISSLKYLHIIRAVFYEEFPIFFEAVFASVINVSPYSPSAAVPCFPKLVSLDAVTSTTKSVSDYGMKFSQRELTF